MSDERGFLTATDRAFLRGEKEYETKQSRYQRREAIAGRARAAFDDFAFLYDVLDEHERNRIFDVVDGVGDIDWAENPMGWTDFQEAIATTIAFLYRSLEGDVNTDVPNTRPSFEQVLTEGLKRGEADRYDRDVYGVKVDYGGVAVVKEPPASVAVRGIQKIRDDRLHELTEAEMLAVLGSYKPDGVIDSLNRDDFEGSKGYARLQEAIEAPALELEDQNVDREE